ncbi:hypothetical protein TEA_000822 [Camellia sinensis var. sinensis]|uniref:Uncharacterized protein n=1 Tax=Camellia sinensis var. sinensis TaxID=542762 RepID=A0A4V3WLQ6_CAMSN|nr:hypothetical protein TEA_000822 [Camellia sinensis var. sinensis]
MKDVDNRLKVEDDGKLRQGILVREWKRSDMGVHTTTRDISEKSGHVMGRMCVINGANQQGFQQIGTINGVRSSNIFSNSKKKISERDQKGFPEELFAVKIYALTPDPPKRVNGARPKAHTNRPGIIK